MPLIKQILLIITKTPTPSVINSLHLGEHASITENPHSFFLKKKLFMACSLAPDMLVESVEENPIYLWISSERSERYSGFKSRMLHYFNLNFLYEHYMLPRNVIVFLHIFLLKYIYKTRATN